MKAVSNFSSYFDKLSEWFMKLRNDCPRFSEYQLLYADAPSLRLALSAFYATVIKFCQHAIGSLQRTGGYSITVSLYGLSVGNIYHQQRLSMPPSRSLGHSKTNSVLSRPIYD